VRSFCLYWESIFGIGVEDPFSFSEECTPAVANAIPKAVDVIYQAISFRSENFVDQCKLLRKMTRQILLDI